MKTYRTSSAEETQKLGEAIATKLITSHKFSTKAAKIATIIALQGDLGAGKTTFAQGFLRGLGIKRRATSPTFIIMRRYKIPSHRSQAASRFFNLFHLDTYRLKQASDMETLEFKIIAADPKNIIIIEWPDRIKEILPKNKTWIRFAHGKKENERRITISLISVK